MMGLKEIKIHKYKSVITVFIIVVAIFFILIILEKFTPLIDATNSKIEYYKFITLVCGGILLVFNYYQLTRRVINEEERTKIEGERKEIQEKSRLDERFKEGVGFLDKKYISSIQIAGIYIIYEVYKIDEENYKNLIIDVFETLLQETEITKIRNTIIELLQKDEKLHYK